ncbi:MAG: phosphatase PAP2 family protein [Clostridia bacterium]|nr:phosphatase PAP2 family protein [Clostridia bacterium]
MDIEYLLLLQNFRNAINDALTPFLESLSLYAVTYLVIIPALIYWCVSKREGLYALASYTCTVAVNAVVKLTACIYRPWIRDARVLPAGDAITTATGYSFPSGHTTTAVPIYGGLAVSGWKKTRWLSVVCIVCALLTGFSRNYLGVHTPQDVIVGFIEGLLALAGMFYLFRYLEKNPEKENWFLLGGIAFCIAGLIYINVKSYPMDYVDGKLLVDPQKMMKDAFGDLGMFMALCIGRYIEKTWVRYEPAASAKTFCVGLLGAVILFFVIQLLGAPMQALFGAHWGNLVSHMIRILFIIALWPAVMKKTCA